MFGLIDENVGRLHAQSFNSYSNEAQIRCTKIELELILFQNDIKGNGCKLTEPVYGTQFDLNALHSDLGKHVSSVVSEKDSIEFNVCGSFSKDCAGVKAPACLTKDGNQIRFGKISSEFFE